MPNPTTTTKKPSPLSLLALHTLHFLVLCTWFSTSSAKATSYNVVDFGAKPDGATDATAAFLSAWKKACSSNKPAGIHVPQGRFLIARAVTFHGQCANRAISITIRGTLVAPSQYTFVGNSLYWLTFDQVSGVSIHGGVLDARGSFLWDCKYKATPNCPIGAAVCYMHAQIFLSTHTHIYIYE